MGRNKENARDSVLQFAKEAVDDARKAQTALSSQVDTVRTLSGDMEMFADLIHKADSAVALLKFNPGVSYGDVRSRAKSTTAMINNYTDEVIVKTVAIKEDIVRAKDKLNNKMRDLDEIVFIFRDNLDNLRSLIADSTYAFEVEDEVNQLVYNAKERMIVLDSLKVIHGATEEAEKAVEKVDLFVKNILENMEGIKMDQNKELAQVTTEEATVAVEVTEATVVESTNDEVIVEAKEVETVKENENVEGKEMREVVEGVEVVEVMEEVAVTEESVIEEALREATEEIEDVEDACDDDVEAMDESKASKITGKVKDSFKRIADLVPEVKDNLNLIEKMSYVEAYVYVKKACARLMRKFAKVGFMKTAIGHIRTALGYLKGLLVKLIKKVAKSKADVILEGIAKAFKFVGGIIKKVASFGASVVLFAGVASVKLVWEFGHFLFNTTKSGIDKMKAKKAEAEEEFDDEDDFEDEVNAKVDAAVEEMMNEMA